MSFVEDIDHSAVTAADVYCDSESARRTVLPHRMFVWTAPSQRGYNEVGPHVIRDVLAQRPPGVLVADPRIGT